LSRRGLLAFVLVCCAASCASGQKEVTIRVGAKNFTEQEVLGEIIAQLIERRPGFEVERRFGLGGTDVCHAALRKGQIHVYAEYTGTALINILKLDGIRNETAAFRAVAGTYRDRFDLEWLPPIGFNNTYAIAVRAEQAEEMGWLTISDLARASSGLRAGFTAEFAERPDGYPGLKNAYGLGFTKMLDLDPGLMYQALAEGQVDVICAFATDGRIAEYNLLTLRDDRSFFPPYDAAPVLRAEILRAHPELRDVLAAMAGTISDEEMRRMNRAVDVLSQDPATVARQWIRTQIGETAKVDLEAGERTARPSFFALAYQRRDELGDKTLEHLVLTALGTSLAILIGVPLGVFIHRRAPARGPVLALTEIVQTIPSLAMLAFLFAIYGLLGTAPAVTALVLYALLPIVLNTFTGLREVPSQLIEAADGMGMSSPQRLRMVELPLAAPVIMAGIRAATVLTVGIATLSTFIGAGGLGDFIARGLARNDTRLTLLGAVPAAIMAVSLSLLLRCLESYLRKSTKGSSR